MTGSAGLGRLVADLGTLLVAVQRLDRCVDVRFPRLMQRAGHAVHQCSTHPWLAGLRVIALSAARRVFADQAAQSQCLRSHRLAARAGKVRVAFAARRDAQHQRAPHIALRARVGAAVAERADIDSAIEYTGRVRKFGEEHQLAVRRGLRRFVAATCMRPPIAWATIKPSRARANIGEDPMLACQPAALARLSHFSVDNL